MLLFVQTERVNKVPGSGSGVREGGGLVFADVTCFCLLSMVSLLPFLWFVIFSLMFGPF